MNRLSPLTTVGLVLFVACASAPKGSRPLTQEEERVVQDVIDELEVTTPVAERLLERARPLFDRQGNDLTDNAELADDIYEVLGKIQEVSDSGRVLMVDETILDGLARARGSSTPTTPADDYILIREPDAGTNFYLEPPVLFHEGAHYLYGAHDWIVGAPVEGELRESDVRDQLLIGLEKKDLPYTLETFYRIGSLWYNDADWALADTNSLIEWQLPAVSEEQAQEFIDEQRTFLKQELDLSAWAQSEADYAHRYFGSEGLGLLEPLELTEQELYETLLEADELFEIHRENVEAALERLREADAEYLPESGQERARSMGSRR